MPDPNATISKRFSLRSLLWPLLAFAVIVVWPTDFGFWILDFGFGCTAERSSHCLDSLSAPANPVRRLFFNPKSKIQNPKSWEPDTRATQDGSGAGQDETAIAINPLDADNAIVVTKDYRKGGKARNYLDTTTDGGKTWVEQPFPMPDPGLPYYLDPAVFYRQDGRAYLLWTSYSDFTHGGLYTSWSDNRGITWSPPVEITRPEGYFDDKAWMTFGTPLERWNVGTLERSDFRISVTSASDRSTFKRSNVQTFQPIYVVWTRFGNVEIYASRSTDGGATWSAPVPVSNGPYRTNADGAFPVVLPDGTLAVVFLQDSTPEEEVATMVLARSTDGGATFGPNTPLFEIVKPPFRLPNDLWRIFTYESLAYDPVRGWLTLVWPDYRYGAANGIDIMVSRSTDGGATWSPAARLNDDPPGLVRDQFFPAVAASTDGRLAAIWLDRRDDPANLLYHAYVRTSTDGGLTWEPAERVSSAPSNPNIAIPPGADGIGDYIGMAGGPGVLWGSWVDTRNGNQDIYAARELFTPLPKPTRTADPTGTSTATPTAFPPTATRTADPTGTSTPCSIGFSDVQPTDYFYEPVRRLYCAGAVSGYADNTFRPYNFTTRGQLTKIVVLAEGWPIDTTGGPHFTDVPPTNPFYGYIETAYNRNIVSGYNCGGPGEPCPGLYFRWTGNITRGQVARIVVEAEGWPIDTTGGPHFTDVPPANPFYGYIETAYNRGVISGYADGTFRWGNSATRGQISKIIYDILVYTHHH